VTALLGAPGVPGTVLAATWKGISKSTDGGLSWQEVMSSGRYFFLVAGPFACWAGGETAALTPFARRSANCGDTWLWSFSHSADDVARDMAFDPSDPNVAFLGLSSGVLLKTVDGALSWSPVSIPSSLGPASLENRAYAPLRIYARATSASLLGAGFFKSDDGADSWDPVMYSSWPSAAGTILVRSGTATDTLFLGTGHGVLRYVETDVVGVPWPSTKRILELRVEPNPLAAAARLTFNLARAADVSLRAIDVSGREVATLLVGKHGAGSHSVVWKPDVLPNGIYFCHLRAGADVATKPVLIVK
jgi:hypothetical protein